MFLRYNKKKKKIKLFSLFKGSSEKTNYITVDHPNH